jgi:hypothetical protein
VKDASALSADGVGKIRNAIGKVTESLIAFLAYRSAEADHFLTAFGTGLRGEQQRKSCTYYRTAYHHKSIRRNIADFVCHRKASFKALFLRTF